MPEKLLHRIAGALPRSIVTESFCIGRGTEEFLLPEEIPAIANAVVKRKREFGAGRVSARRAMRRLGVAALPIPVGPQREPVWPAGIVGSITHEGEYAISAVAEESNISVLGIDLATRGDLGEELISIVCGEEEIADISLQKRQFGGDDPFKLIFSIKESVYKCLFPVVREVFDFGDVSVRFRFQDELVGVQLYLNNQAYFSQIDCRLKVVYLYEGDYVFTCVWSGHPSFGA